MTVLRTLFHDLVLLAATAHLQADYAYDAFTISTSLLEPRLLFAAELLAAASAGCVVWARRDQRAGFAAGWVLVTLLPVLQFVPHHEIFAERYLYLPSVGAA